MDSLIANRSRLVQVSKVDGGFGFTLRHFVVYPQDDPDTNPELDDTGVNSISSNISFAASGCDPIDTIFVKEVRRNGAAEVAGLQKGDQIVAVNGKPVSGLTYTQVVALIQSSETRVDLVVLPCEQDELQMAYKDSAYEAAISEPYRGPPQGIPTPPIPNRSITVSQTPSSSSAASRSSSEEKLTNRRGSGEEKAKLSRIQATLYVPPPYTRSLTTSQLPVTTTFSSVTTHQSVPADMHHQEQNQKFYKHQQRMMNERRKFFACTEEHSENENQGAERLLKFTNVVSSNTSKFEKLSSPEKVSIYFKSSPNRRLHRPALRQPSYLNAINSPTVNRNSDPTPAAVHNIQASTESVLRSASNIAMAVMQADNQNQVSSEGYSEVSMRKTYVTAEEREAKFVHRTSYLLASDTNVSTSFNSAERSQSVEERSQENEPNNASLSAPMSTTHTRIVLDQLQIPIIHESDSSSASSSPITYSPVSIFFNHNFTDTFTTTPTKITRKFKKAFFTDKTPRIVEENILRKNIDGTESTDLIYEGRLLYKVHLVRDGKRSNDRSWKPAWAQLRGQLMYLFKDKPEETDQTSPSFTQDEATTIPVSPCMVDIAYDYVKKNKNVIKVTTQDDSQYLFQTEKKEDMISWSKNLRGQSNSEEMQEALTKQATSPQVIQKSTKNKTAKVLSRAKYSAVPISSPSPKQKRQAQEKVTDEEQSRSWKNMAKKFATRGRYGSQNNSQTEMSSTNTACSGGTFGIPLEDCPTSKTNPGVPIVVERCCKVVEENGLDMTGIYRVPGNKAAVKMLQEDLNKAAMTRAFNLAENEKWQDVHVVTSLLKCFFRQLPDPLITKETYKQFISANRYEDKDKRMLHLKRHIAQLPDNNRETFQYLARHLAKVADKGDINKMDVRNLSIVFGPTLVRHTDDSVFSLVTDMSDQCQIVQSIITHHEWFFGSWEKDSEIPEDEDTTDSAPLSGMNQRLLEHAEEIEFGDKRKKKGKKEKWKSCDNSEGPSFIERDSVSDIGLGYNERNIDKEIELRRDQLSVSTNGGRSRIDSSPNIKVKIHTAYKEKSMPLPLTITDRELLRDEERRAEKNIIAHQRHLKQLDNLIALTEKEIEQDENLLKRPCSLDELRKFNNISDDEISTLTGLFSEMKRPSYEKDDIRITKIYRQRRRHTVSGVMELEAFKSVLARMCQRKDKGIVTCLKFSPNSSQNQTQDSHDLKSWFSQQRQISTPVQLTAPATGPAGRTPFPRHLNYESSL